MISPRDYLWNCGLFFPVYSLWALKYRILGNKTVKTWRHKTATNMRWLKVVEIEIGQRDKTNKDGAETDFGRT